MEMRGIPNLDFVISTEKGLVDDRDGGEKLLLFLARGVEPGGDVSPGDEKHAAGLCREGVPEGEDQGSAVEDELRVGLAEGAGGLAQRTQRACRVMVRRPSSPLVTQAAQRQRLMSRRAVRKIWQTGQRWTKT